MDNTEEGKTQTMDGGAPIVDNTIGPDIPLWLNHVLPKVHRSDALHRPSIDTPEQMLIVNRWHKAFANGRAISIEDDETYFDGSRDHDPIFVSFGTFYTRQGLQFVVSNEAVLFIAGLKADLPIQDGVRVEIRTIIIPLTEFQPKQVMLAWPNLFGHTK